MKSIHKDNRWKRLLIKNDAFCHVSYGVAVTCYARCFVLYTFMYVKKNRKKIKKQEGTIAVKWMNRLWMPGSNTWVVLVWILVLGHHFKRRCWCLKLKFYVCLSSSSILWLINGMGKRFFVSRKKNDPEVWVWWLDWMKYFIH